MSSEDQLAKLELAEFVDACTILADDRDIESLSMAFAENAMLCVREKGVDTINCMGRTSIAKAHLDYLSHFSDTLHLNGQKVFDINGDHARGTVYTQGVLTEAITGGGKIQHTVWMCHRDTYIKENSAWYICRRETELRCNGMTGIG